MDTDTVACRICDQQFPPDPDIWHDNVCPECAHKTEKKGI